LPAAPGPVEPRSETILMARGATRSDPPTEEFATVAVPKAQLIEDLKGKPGKVYPLGPATSIGRTPDNQIAIDVREVSRRHARIDMRPDGTFVLTDLGSGNGTFVNDKRVREHTLASGDRVRIGNQSFVYKAG
jgi:hypothetical protein